jgi:hypothetical protein
VDDFDQEVFEASRGGVTAVFFTVPVGHCTERWRDKACDKAVQQK